MVAYSRPAVAEWLTAYEEYRLTCQRANVGPKRPTAIITPIQCQALRCQRVLPDRRENGEGPHPEETDDEILTALRQYAQNRRIDDPEVYQALRGIRMNYMGTDLESAVLALASTLQVEATKKGYGELMEERPRLFIQLYMSKLRAVIHKRLQKEGDTQPALLKTDMWTTAQKAGEIASSLSLAVDTLASMPEAEADEILNKARKRQGQANGVTKRPYQRDERPSHTNRYSPGARGERRRRHSTPHAWQPHKRVRYSGVKTPKPETRQPTWRERKIECWVCGGPHLRKDCQKWKRPTTKEEKKT